MQINDYWKQFFWMKTIKQNMEKSRSRPTFSENVYHCESDCSQGIPRCMNFNPQIPPLSMVENSKRWNPNIWRVPRLEKVELNFWSISSYFGNISFWTKGQIKEMIKLEALWKQYFAILTCLF